MYRCVCGCDCVYAYVYMCVCESTCVYIYIYARVNVCVYMYVCVYVCMYVCLYVCVYVCMCVLMNLKTFEARVQFLTAVLIRSVMRDMSPCGLENRCQHFGGAFFLHL